MAERPRLIAPRYPVAALRAASLPMAHGIKRLAVRQRAGMGALPQQAHGIDTMNVIRVRIFMLGQQRILAVHLRQPDRRCCLLEQINHRRAGKQQIACRYRPQQACASAAGSHVPQAQMQGPALASRRQAWCDLAKVDIKKLKFVRAGEVFCQQAVGPVGTRLARQQRLLRQKTDGTQRHLRQRQLHAAGLDPGIRGMQKQGIAQGGRQRWRAIDEDAHGRQPQLLQRTGGRRGHDIDGDRSRYVGR